jgi:hypothetical protein
MARTNSTKVQAILGSNYDATLSDLVDGVILDATSIVDQVVTCAANKGVTLTAAVLERMETNLAAWLYGSGDQFYTSKKTLDAAGSFEPTRYKDAALALDSSGCLKAQLNGGSTRVTASWLGKRKSNQTDYKDRD